MKYTWKAYGIGVKSALLDGYSQGFDCFFYYSGNIFKAPFILIYRYLCLATWVFARVSISLLCPVFGILAMVVDRKNKIRRLRHQYKNDASFFNSKIVAYKLLKKKGDHSVTKIDGEFYVDEHSEFDDLISIKEYEKKNNGSTFHDNVVDISDRFKRD